MTVIVPTNVSEITQAIETMLNDSLDVGQAGVLVERSAEERLTPTEHGWVGIYRDGINYPPRTLGMGSGYRNQEIRLYLLVQESDPSSGDECEDRLETLLQKVVGVLLSDPSLGGTVNTLDAFSVTYRGFKGDAGYMQMARIDFTGLIPVSAM
jgi:hypothetical protein